MRVMFVDCCLEVCVNIYMDDEHLAYVCPLLLTGTMKQYVPYQSWSRVVLNNTSRTLSRRALPLGRRPKMRYVFITGDLFISVRNRRVEKPGLCVLNTCTEHYKSSLTNTLQYDHQS